MKTKQAIVNLLLLVCAIGSIAFGKVAIERAHRSKTGKTIAPYAKSAPNKTTLDNLTKIKKEETSLIQTKEIK